ncbi:MAG: tetratricopeptide repeat protein [Bacteroidales bacterium]
MKAYPIAIIILAFQIINLKAQDNPSGSTIDLMLLRGDYGKVIDTCSQILVHDSLNAGVYYKMGLAYQNLLEEDRSLESFSRAANLNPGSKVYIFMLAKGYYNKGKYDLAGPLLSKLCSIDSMNWLYAHYLTGVYMQDNKFDDAIDIYKKFLSRDSANHVYLDRIAYASLKKGDFAYATELYEKSLSLDRKNISAIKNLAYLYTAALRPDTAVQLLSDGIETDPSDMDLYVRRAQLNYSQNYTKRALDDYLVILASGDSSKLYLKRAGIGYCNNFQPEESLSYLLKAYDQDSSDFETCSYLGQSYNKLGDMNTSIHYYNRAVKLLTPVNMQLGLTYYLIAESQKGGGMYREAIKSYIKARNIRLDPNINMVIANIYDEKLNNRKQAIMYYQRYLDEIKNIKALYSSEYADKIKKRLEYLKTNPVN